jgi:dethiobiotin synthetase
MAHRGLRPAGVMLGWWPGTPDLACRCNLADLQTLTARPLAGALVADAGQLSAPDFSLAARAGLGPSLGGDFDAADFTRRHDPRPPPAEEPA